MINMTVKSLSMKNHGNSQKFKSDKTDSLMSELKHGSRKVRLNSHCHPRKVADAKEEESQIRTKNTLKNEITSLLKVAVNIRREKETSMSRSKMDTSLES